MVGLFHALFVLLALGPPLRGFAQKRSDRGKGEGKTADREKVGPKRTDRTVPEAERVKVITKTEFIRVPVRSNKGYLSVVAVSAASVTLTPLEAEPKKSPPIKEIIKDEDGTLNLINLLPGKYKIAVEHPDYQPYSDTIQVDPALPVTFVATSKMVSLYGQIRIGGAPPDAKVFLDDAAVAPARQASDNQSAVISKVPVGKHRLRISKPGYVDFAREIDVLPGRQSFVSAPLALALVTLNLTSEPGARVYVGNEEKAVIPPGGNVRIPLAPGRQSILVLKDGYQEWRKELTLSLANDPVNERIDLVPVPNSAEGDWQPALGPRKWSPTPAAWRFDASGALIRGDKPILYDTEPGRDFNTYRDFKLEFDVVFTNGKSVAWVARAKDPDNYYLFEISGPQSSPKFHFYVCRAGKLEWKDSQQIVEKMDKRGDSFHIIFEARGNRFDTRMTIAGAPSATPHLIGIFQDDSFSYGGIGFRAKDQSESLLQTFFVIPLQ
ncbi:MAG: PEGA domain-containing protein [Blastocatellia bacterium]